MITFPVIVCSITGKLPDATFDFLPPQGSRMGKSSSSSSKAGTKFMPQHQPSFAELAHKEDGCHTSLLQQQQAFELQTHASISVLAAGDEACP